MRVLVFNLRMDAEDGVLGFTTDWVNALARRCERVVVVTMSAGVICVEPNVTVYSVGQERGYGKTRRLVRFYSLVWRVVACERIDVAFAHMNFLFALLAAPLLKLKRIPIVLWYAHKQTSVLLRLTERMVDRVVTSSASGFQIASPKVRIIGQGIDTRRFMPADRSRSGPIRLLSFGRISRIKRLELIVEAARWLRENAPDLPFTLEIVGDPLSDDCRAYEAQLHQQVKQAGLEAQVRFLPGVPFYSAHLAFQAADVFLNPSDTDSVDKTVLEALACGLPVVTSNIAFREILPATMQEASIVPKNDPAALARAVTVLAGWDDARWRSFREQGRAVAQQHSLDLLAHKLMVEFQGLRRPVSQ